MIIPRILILLTAFLLSLPASLQAVSIPVTFSHDGAVYKYDAFLKDMVLTLREDIDGDRRDETIVMFPASDENNVPQAFAWIQGQGYEFRIPVYEYPQRLEAVDLDQDGARELFFYAYGGIRHQRLFVFRYEREKGLRKLFENGSARGVFFSVDNGIPTIKVGQDSRGDEGWAPSLPEPRWEVYQWDGQDFRYAPSASTAEQTSAPRVEAASGRHPVRTDRIKKGDTLIYRHETVRADDQGTEEITISRDDPGFRVSRETHQEYQVVRREDFGEAYGFYLKTGLAWEEGRPGLTQRCSRKPGTTCYHAQKTEDVAVPAALFQSCFKIVIDNIPELDVRRYCPGTGVVRSEYRRDMPFLHRVVELESINRK